MKTLSISRPASKCASDTYRMNVHRGKANDERSFLGSLYLDYAKQSDNQALFERCTDSEIIQCTEYVKTYNKMRRCIGSDNKRFKAFNLHLDQWFPDLLYEVAQKAQAANVEFYPQDFIVDSLLTKLGDLHTQLDLSSIFEKYRFTPDYKKNRSADVPKATLKQIIQSVLDLNDEPNHIAKNFNANLLERYNKKRPLPIPS